MEIVFGQAEPADEARVAPREMEAKERGISFEELLAEYDVLTPAKFFMGAYERRLTAFVQQRVREAQFAEAWHLLPGDIPIDQQPWWKTFVWEQYLTGFSETFGK